MFPCSERDPVAGDNNKDKEKAADDFSFWF